MHTLDPSELLLIASTAAILSFLLCLVLTPLARRFDLVDHPSERKVHATPIPMVGGVAVFMVFAAVTWFMTPAGPASIPLLLACGLMMITGLADDLHELSPRSRFIVQIIACCIMIFADGVVLTDLGSLLWNGVLSLGWFSVPMTIFSALGVINAFNMVDGMDGLSSMIFMIACAAMAWLALMAGQHANAAILIAAVGAVFGFFLLNARFPWNPRAHMFLGDSGSVFLGLFLAWQFVELGSGDERAYAPITAVWILGVPIMDTLRLMFQRWRRGESSLAADQCHLHHAFLKAGFSVRQTWFAITALVLFTTFVGLAGHIMDWPEYLMFYGFVIFSLVYQRIMNQCWRNGRFLGRIVGPGSL